MLNRLNQEGWVILSTWFIFDKQMGNSKQVSSYLQHGMSCKQHVDEEEKQLTNCGYATRFSSSLPAT